MPDRAGHFGSRSYNNYYAQEEKSMEEELKAAALEYHRFPTPGKISVVPTKGLINQHSPPHIRKRPKW